MKSVTIKTEEGHEVWISEERGVCVLTCATSAGTVAHKLPAWVVQALMQHTTATETESTGSSCSYVDMSGDTARCRRKAYHQGPHSFSLNEARALDAVVTHEDLRKLRNEILDELIEVSEVTAPWFNKLLKLKRLGEAGIL